MKFAIERTFLVNVIAGAICLFGVFTLVNMKRDLIPPLSWPYIQVTANLSGASTSEVERLVTFPIEEALKGVPHVKNMWSDTSAGSMSMWLEFPAEYQNQLESIQNDVRDQITSISHRLPRDLDPVQVQIEKIRDIFLATYSIENYDSKNPEHRAALIKVQNQFSQIPGVARVNLDQDDRNLFVRIDPKKMTDHEISIPQVRLALAKYMEYEPLGQIRWNGARYGVEMRSQEISIAAVESLPVTSNKTGQQVQIKDIANVEWDAWEKQTRWLWNGKTVAEIELRKNLTSDSISLHEEVKKKLPEISQGLPKPLNLIEAFDGPRFIRQQIENLSFNGWFGFILVVVLLGVFLGYRSALMAAWGLPVSYLGTFIVLSWLGISIDLLSILGLILVVGILVDDAIIVTDRYNDLLATGLAPKEAAHVAAKELIVPVTGTILTTIVAFLPIMTIPSNLTWFLQAIPIVVIVSLTLSWAECFFILPNHLAHIVKVPEKPVGHNFMLKLQDWFEKSLRFTLKFKWVFLTAVLVLCLGGFYLAATKLQQHFNISIGSEQIVIYVDLKESSSLDETVQKIRPVTDYVATLDKNIVEYSSTQVGSYRRDGETKDGFRFARITLGINGNHPRPVELRKKLQPDLAAELAKLKTEDFDLLTSEERKRGEEDYNKNTVSVFINGQDEAQFLRLEEAIHDAVASGDTTKGTPKDTANTEQGIPHITAKSSDDDKLMDVWSFNPDLQALSRYNISRSEVSAQIREHISAYEVGYARVGGENVSVLTQVLYPEKIKFNELDHVPVINALGEQIPLSWLGQWQSTKLPENIQHDNGIRFGEVKFKYDDKHFTVETAKAAIDKKLNDVRKQFPAFEIKVENANKRDEENKKWIMKVSFYSLVGVAVVLIAMLSSFVQPILVMIPVPLGIAGALLMVYLHGQSLTLMAIVGFLGVIGVAVNDSIVLTHHYNRLKSVTQYLSLEDLIVSAAKSRLRAIMLTSVTTLGGLFPTAYGIFGESGFTQPIAFTMAWGLFFSTFATLYVLPALLKVAGVFSLKRRDMSRPLKPTEKADEILPTQSITPTALT